MTALKDNQEVAAAWVFGWDPTPGVVAVWADLRGRVWRWQRLGGELSCTRTMFRPWVLATNLDDVQHLGRTLAHVEPGQQPTAAINVQQLQGPPGSYRFLLSARDGRTLEAAILRGASQRLGHPVRRLRELGDCYFTYSPTEQYLIQTGQVFFRGLAYADLHRLQFDLETTALSPEDGRVFMVAVRDTRGLATVLEAPTPADEPQLIADLCALIRERDPDVVENHNLIGFDLPFLWARAQHLGVPLALGRAGAPPLMTRTEMPGGWRRAPVRFQVAGRALLDTLEAVIRHDFVVRSLPSYGLKAVAQAYGVANPDRVYLPGAAIYETYQTDPAAVRHYALDDVAAVDALSPRLLSAAFALAGMAPRPFERLVSAGPAMGILEPMLVRAYLYSGAAPPCLPAAHRGDGHAGGATQLFAAGVARQVVKADIASMYPSIMRTFQIGPACDPLNVLLTLVDQLTSLRLKHKQAARDALSGSAEAQDHTGMQAAMKLLINSAYGYMGAESMAMFADRAAADAVTAKGREILGQVTNGLAARGMVLLEADTDGVFFAAPEGWTEAQERALVAEVAATLPAGLQLEYDGRYAAMLSHEVKNYALRTYDGELILRGVGFVSRRNEPFGTRFLEQALQCLLAGDVVGLHRVYHATVDALRSHTIPVADVSTVARLTKPAELYLERRPSAREAPYEALLAAGRTSWEAGERVRYYRAPGGAVVWIPEGAPSDGDCPPYDHAHYLQVLRTSYASRLRKAFRPEDFERLTREGGQEGLFDTPISQIEPCWILAGQAAAPQTAAASPCGDGESPA